MTSLQEQPDPAQSCQLDITASEIKAPDEGNHGPVSLGIVRLAPTCNIERCEHPPTRVRRFTYSRDDPSIADYQVEDDSRWYRITSQSGAKGTQYSGPEGSFPFVCMKAKAKFISPKGWRGQGVVSGLAQTEGGDTEGAKSGCSRDVTALDETFFPDEQQGGPV